MTFGERLRELREDLDETQRDIAELLFVSSKVISDDERGIHFPRDERVITKLAEYFEVSTDYLLGVTNVKNHTYGDKFFNAYNELPYEYQELTIDFINMLAKKAKK